jgi:mannose-6-phosphate isomerase-like protein (cupin superfamily)
MLVEHIDDLPMQPASHSEGELPVLFGTAFMGELFKGRWGDVEYVTVPPGSAIPIHKHEQDEEVYFIFAGTGLLTIDGKEYQVGPGVFSACPAGSAHGLRNNGSQEIRLIVIGVRLTD